MVQVETRSTGMERDMGRTEEHMGTKVGQVELMEGGCTCLGRRKLK